MISSLMTEEDYQRLQKENPEFKELCEEHLRLKRETARLNKLKAPTIEENALLHDLKKQKLELKDRAMAMLEEFHALQM